MNIIDYLNYNNISQVYISPALDDFKKFFISKNVTNIKLYNDTVDINLDTLFFGVYRDIDIANIRKHKIGKIYILWYDNDCNPQYFTRKKNVRNIIRNRNIIHLTHCDLTSKYLDHFKIKHKVVYLYSKYESDDKSIGKNENESETESECKNCLIVLDKYLKGGLEKQDSDC